MRKILGGCLLVLLAAGPALLLAGPAVADPVDAACTSLEALGCETYYQDADGDGYGDPETAHRSPVPPDGEVTTGDDCDDTDPDVHPGAVESYDGRDEDCDGEVDEVVLVFSEIMANPDAVRDSDGEYLELANVSAEPVDLAGTAIVVGSRTCELTGLLDGGDHLVAARSEDPEVNGGFDADVRCTFQLTNSGTLVRLASPAGDVDAVDYTGWDVPTGASLSLDPRYEDPLANDFEGAWCAATSPMPGGDLGTPGAPNDPC